MRLVGQTAVVVNNFAVRTVGDDAVLRAELLVLSFGVGSEAPVAADDDLLAARELVASAAQGLHSVGLR